MTFVSDDPSWWPSINSHRTASYFVVAASAMVIYDWVLTFGQEVELVWRQRWSLMTALYLSVRYTGILFVVGNILFSVPTISMTDAGCLVLYFTVDWMSIVVNAILGVILITRLYAMYQRSIKVLILLVVVFLAANIFDGVIGAISMRGVSVEEFILSGTYQCTLTSFEGDIILLYSIAWILTPVWEVLALCLAVWIAVKHFRGLRHHSAGGIIRDCFTVMIQTHLVYFASFVALSCFELSSFFSTFADPTSLGTQFFFGFLNIFQFMQMVVLGPRLVLGVREYHAKLMADSDVATDVTSIAFQERVHVPTGSSV